MSQNRGIEEGDECEVDMGGTVISRSRGRPLQIEPLPDHILEIFWVGGLIPLLKRELRQR